ncbi:hypothetical protein ACLX1H_001201 [Fusarium chlamydosporum]
MAQTNTLLSDYINFDDQNANLTDIELSNKKLTFCAAAAVSHLCDEKESGVNIDKSLHQKEEYRFIREYELISSVYSTVPISKKQEIKQTPALIAWSNRLQTIFLGISCIRDISDPKLSPDARTQATEGVGSRFYQGLIDNIAEGALATASSYIAIFDRDSYPNVWEENQDGISVITFGSPSCHFAEPKGTSTSWKMHLSRNFHHVINPYDYVPFALNDQSRRYKRNLDDFTPPLVTMSPTIETFWPLFENCLDSLLKKTGKFCHFGCMYSVTTEIQSCVQIQSFDSLPQIPSPAEVDEYHKMAHYLRCIRNSAGTRLLQKGSVKSNGGVKQDDLPSIVLPMPATVTNCLCMVENDQLLVCFNASSTIMQYLLSEAFFRTEGKEVPLTIIGCLPDPDDKYRVSCHAYTTMRFVIDILQASVRMEYKMDNKDKFKHIGEVSIALQKGITLRDIFGRPTIIDVDEVKVPSLDQGSQPGTFESIRIAMIRVLVVQISKVQGLRTQNTPSNSHTPEEVLELDEKVKTVVNCIDRLVRDAVPHLVISQMTKAFEILKTFWPRDFKTDVDSHDSTPGNPDDGGLLPDIPGYCPPVLRKLLTGMLKNRKDLEFTQSGTSLKAWTNAKRPTLEQQFTNLPNFARALKKFSQGLYHRPEDPSRRMKEAVDQFQDIMGTIQLCHLIIITQLDAPYDWYCRSNESWKESFVTAFQQISLAVFRQASVVALNALPRSLAAVTVPGLSAILEIGALFSPSVAIAGGLSALYCGYRIANHFLNRPQTCLDLSFLGVLAITVQVLDIFQLDTDDMMEKALFNHVKNDIPNCRTPETLRKWRDILENGLKQHSSINHDQWTIIPDFFWAKWLFTVAQVAQLRIELLDKICIGVQGSTEAGKSEMLTVLTGAPENHFNPGSTNSCRTLEIQSYDSNALGAIFLDSPGFDDQDAQVRHMAEVFQELFTVVIIVIPMQRTRSEATESAMSKAISLLRDRSDRRPLRILLSKADGLEFHRKDKKKFRGILRDVKSQFMTRMRNSVGPEFTSCRGQPFGDGVICAPETLDDIVKPFSTYAQMALDEPRALSDCGTDYYCRIDIESHFESLRDLADAGEIWDIESLRSWLRGLSPTSVPMSTRRVRKYR